MIVAITGHRPNRLGNEWDHKGPYSDYIWQRMEEIVNILKPETMISGMALGADFLWALIAKKHKIPLIATVPFEGQEKRWNKAHQDEYYNIINDKQTKVIITDKTLTNRNTTLTTKYKHRDQITVGYCQILVAVFNDNWNSGTGYTINFCKRQDKPIIYINPNGWKE